MTRRRALVIFASVIAAVAFGALTSAWADDCTDTGDCAMAPRNIDGATAIAASLPFIYFGWRHFQDGRGVAVARPPVEAPATAAELAALVDDVKAEFERLQKELRMEAAAQLASLRDVNRRYDEKWKEAIAELEDYMRAYPDLLPGLNAIWEQFGSREWARKVAEWCDVALQVASAGAGIARAGVGAVAREAAGEVAEAAARRASREAAEEIGEAVVRRAEREAAEAAARRTEQEAAEAAARRDVAAAERRLADAQADEARRQAERAATEARARADAERAIEVANRAEAEGQLMREINPVNQGPGRRDINCMDCARAVDDTLAGRPRVAPPRDVAGYHSELERAYGRRFAQVVDRAELDEVVASAPPGARGIVRIGWAGENSGHAFNAVNRNGHVFYPDGQAGAMFDGWNDVGDIIFMWTHLP